MTATAAELTLRLSNHDHRFDAVVFEGAEIFASLSFTYTDEIRKLKTESGYVLTTEDGVGIELEAYNLSPSDEEPPRIDIPVGMFIVDNSPRRTSTIELTALDRMVRFDKSADRSRFVFPCTLKELLLTICSVCNVRLADPSLKGLLNADYIVQEYPTGDNLTYRQLLIWITQIACAYAYMDWDGLLRLDWYQTTTPGLVLTEAQRATSDIQQDSEIAIQRLEVTDTNGDVFIGKGMDAEPDPENPNRDIYIPTMRGMPKIYNEYSGNSYTTALEPCQLTLMIGSLSVEHFMMAVFTEFKIYGMEWIPFGLWAPATTPNSPTFLEWNAGIFVYDMNAVPTEVPGYLNEILQNIRETENYQIRLTRFPSEEKPAEVIQ